MYIYNHNIQYDIAANQIKDILVSIDNQCDTILNKYINENVKDTLTYAEKSQTALYDTYQKVR